MHVSVVKEQTKKPLRDSAVTTDPRRRWNLYLNGTGLFALSMLWM